MPKPHLTFLFLKAFDTTGGIEKMNRVILRALADWQKNGAATVQAWSPYEYKTDLRYFPAEQFRGYAGRRWAFLGTALPLRRAGKARCGPLPCGPAPPC